MLRYYIGFLTTVGLLILLIFLLFHGGGKPTVPTTSVPLYNYATTGSEVRLTIDGPINAAQDHQQVQITANRNTVTFNQLQGYDGTIVNHQDFNNSQNAYAVLLHALAIAGFTEGDTSSTLSDERGHCALGDRYIFELIQGGNDLERFWATSCATVVGSYQGNLPLTLSLFEAQVPAYQKLVSNVTF